MVGERRARRRGFLWSDRFVCAFSRRLPALMPDRLDLVKFIDKTGTWLTDLRLTHLRHSCASCSTEIIRIAAKLKEMKQRGLQRADT